MTEFGSLALVDEGDGDGVTISLPGVRRGTIRSLEVATRSPPLLL